MNFLRIVFSTSEPWLNPESVTLDFFDAGVRIENLSEPITSLESNSPAPARQFSTIACCRSVQEWGRCAGSRLRPVNVYWKPAVAAWFLELHRDESSLPSAPGQHHPPVLRRPWHDYRR